MTSHDAAPVPTVVADGGFDAAACGVEEGAKAVRACPIGAGVSAFGLTAARDARKGAATVQMAAAATVDPSFEAAEVPSGGAGRGAVAVAGRCDFAIADRESIYDKAPDLGLATAGDSGGGATAALGEAAGAVVAVSGSSGDMAAAVTAALAIAAQIVCTDSMGPSSGKISQSATSRDAAPVPTVVADGGFDAAACGVEEGAKAVRACPIGAGVSAFGLTAAGDARKGAATAQMAAAARVDPSFEAAEVPSGGAGRGAVAVAGCCDFAIADCESIYDKAPDLGLATAGDSGGGATAALGEAAGAVVAVSGSSGDMAAAVTAALAIAAQIVCADSMGPSSGKVSQSATSRDAAPVPMVVADGGFDAAVCGVEEGAKAVRACAIGAEVSTFGLTAAREARKGAATAQMPAVTVGPSFEAAEVLSGTARRGDVVVAGRCDFASADRGSIYDKAPDLGLATAGSGVTAALGKAAGGVVAVIDNSGDMTAAVSAALAIAAQIVCTDSGAVTPAPGLVNLGNTCFVNAVLQVLVQTRALVEGIQVLNHSPCRDAMKKFCVLRSFKKLLTLTSSGRGAISPLDFIRNMKCFFSWYQRFEQGDSHEFLGSFLCKLRICVSDPKTLCPQNGNLVDSVFGGLLVSLLHCRACGRCSEAYEPFTDLSLDVRGRSLANALESFTVIEKIEDLRCDSCRNTGLMEKQILVENAPNVLILHLKRFSVSIFGVEKIDKHVEFPFELDLQPFVHTHNSANVMYDLYGIVVHEGESSSSGHYYSYVKSASKVWYCFDDSLVTTASSENILSENAYILFYARRQRNSFKRISESESFLSPGSGIPNSFQYCRRNVDQPASKKHRHV